MALSTEPRLPRWVFVLCVVFVQAAPVSKISPPPIQWVKGYTFGKSESHPHAGVQTADGGFLVVGDGQNYSRPATVPGPNRTIMLLRTDQDGNARFQLELGTQGWNYGKFAIELQDGRLAIAGALTEPEETTGLLALKRAVILLDRHGEPKHQGHARLQPHLQPFVQVQ